MRTGISKRQQQRNEKALAELLRVVPGNDRCADCGAATPGWASWNMGIFLCMRCAALHRKLGTHISKVKSLTMDTWTSEQVDNMKSNGNILANKIYNPRNVKPSIPADVDEADACMERFIRQKYQHRTLANGKPRPPSREGASFVKPLPDPMDDPPSPEGSPPPLPPKTGKFFGFGLRSASSTSNLRRKKGKSDIDYNPPAFPQRPTQGLGAPVADVTTASFESKMATLREMGFNNDKRNETVLRGLNEDLDRAVETLVRLGEGSNPASGARTPASITNTASTASARPVPPPKLDTSTNPFERAGASQTQSQPPSQPQSASYNPFDRPTPQPQSAQPLESSFQNLQVSRPLFPHSTGGYPNNSGSMPQAMYQQPFTPPVTSTFSHQNPYASSPQPVDNSFNPFFQTAPQPQASTSNQPYPSPLSQQTNPFFNAAPQNSSIQQSQSQPQSQPQSATSTSVPTLPFPPPRHANTMPVMSSTSPFGTSPFGPGPSSQSQPQQQQQQAQSIAQGSYNPFQSATAPATPQSAGSYPNQFPPQFQSQFQPQQPQQLVPQGTGRMDKNSILSLYNLAPSQLNIPPIPEQPPTQQQPANGLNGSSPVPPLTNSLNSTPQTQPGSFMPSPQPTSGSFMASRNPFNGATNGAAPAGSGLAAQAGVSPFPQSSGLGIGMAAGTGAPGTAPPMGMGMGMNPPPSAAGGPPGNPAFPRIHMTKPSVDINGLQNGRHSPDAFASLSARYG
ncbi:hypothetical protein N7474_008188 [Penicillium riverlandense]|uniref:uncharacterized protein n=1 Tax=Penicillium riverlandense TaxID=1903569 RepID=UPI0025471DC7|nr:uncharacterized protein N7474_008188 [Penicillium riverlandense]KAJ5811887.1 hypothetical protein N7474_008188 [Penicillium riverlandense]